jgi:Tol biopolymer transport system component
MLRLHPGLYATLAFALPAAAQTGGTTRVSLDSAGGQANGQSQAPSISADGRFVAFRSQAANLVAGDFNGLADIFVRDRLTGQTTLASVSSLGLQADGASDRPALSADGRYVAFVSSATTLVAGDTNGVDDVFLRDLQAGTTTRVSVGPGGAQGDFSSGNPAISGDGRFVGFMSHADNLVAGDTNHLQDIFVHDNGLGATVRVSVDSAGLQANSASNFCALSSTGRFVAFSSLASNLVPGDSNGSADIFLRDTQANTTTRVSLSSFGNQALGGSDFPAISADGLRVAFVSSAANLVPGDTNLVADVFVRDLLASTTTRASVDSGGAQSNGACGNAVALSADGRFVGFESLATNLVPGDGNGVADIFVRELAAGSTIRVSVDSGGIQGNGACDPAVALSGDGRYACFSSLATNLVAGDTNGAIDVFLRDRDATGFTLLCDPGSGGMLACPCANPPFGPGLGCNNSSATGGALLSASGLAYLASDSLVFAASGEKPHATSVVLQGDALVAGLVFGQGLRCAGGQLLRLYTKQAVGGSIVAPNFGAGDPSVSARSAALGDTILAGQSRWYLVYYRDPIVLGGCPVTDTFNATATGRVDWSL